MLWGNNKHKMKTYEQMVGLFEQANNHFLKNNESLFLSNVNERSLCSALMLCLNNQIASDPSFKGYYTDVEYNRNQGKIKTIIQTNQGQKSKIITINCDLILHSRGEHPEQDNLIAIEMKKSTQTRLDKEKDRDRLRALTLDSFNNTWSYDGHTLPEHVCRYVLGVYYEINLRKNTILIEYYCRGKLVDQYRLKRTASY